MDVVGSDEGLDCLLGDSGVRKVCSLQTLAAQDGKPDFDKAEPGTVDGQEMELEGSFRAIGEPSGDLCRSVEADGVHNHMDDLVGWSPSVEQVEQFTEFARAVLGPHHAAHLAVVDAKGSQQVDGAVADVLEFATRWSARRHR